MAKQRIAIIGMGIAGAILSHNLLQEDCEITIYNKNNPVSSSRVAAGMFNSIIPRRVTKSWLADELNPICKNYYLALEKELNAAFYNPLDILHVFEYNMEQNDWLGKIKREEFYGYFEENPLIHPSYPLLHSPLGAVIIKQGGYCNTETMLQAFELYFKGKGCYEEQFVNSQEIEILPTATGPKYGIHGTEYDKIIFCEGVESSQNKWFHNLPFKFVKGELLHVKIDGLGLKEILLGGVFLVPWGKRDEYLLGSTYEWDFTDASPTEGAKEKLLKRVKDYLPQANIEILEHRAGIRPAVSDRRPLIGAHPEEEGIYIFNGFGSKAISLAPYFARQMVAYLLENKEIMDQVDVKRVYSMQSQK